MELAHSRYNKMDEERDTNSMSRQRGAGGSCLSGKKGCVVPLALKNTGSYSVQGGGGSLERPCGSKLSGFTWK